MTVSENYKKIQDKVASACARVGKKPEEIQRRAREDPKRISGSAQTAAGQT